MNRKLIIVLVVAATILGLLYWWGSYRMAKDQETAQKARETIKVENGETPVADRPEIIAQDLNIPWEIAFLPDKSLLVTERPGTLRHVTSQTAITVQGVAHVGEGGLMGLALHPKFADNHYLYLYLTTRTGNGLTNRVERYRFNENQLSDRTIIIEGIPGSSNHDGGRLAFGPDGYLYVTTGDAEQQNLAQDTNSLAGKILRLRDDGSLPADNPFNNAVYSYGHRNPQGLAWDNQGQLWATEHGPSGSQSGYDELNLIEKGKNYGWPVIRGDQAREGMATPVANSGTSDTWAPAGLAYHNGKLYFTGLRGEAVYVATLKSGNKVDLKSYFKGQYGRLRAAVVSPDSYLYISTSNRDGRGTVKAGDDKIIKLRFELFGQ